LIDTVATREEVERVFTGSGRSLLSWVWAGCSDQCGNLLEKNTNKDKRRQKTWTI